MIEMNTPKSPNDIHTLCKVCNSDEVFNEVCEMILTYRRMERLKNQSNKFSPFNGRFVRLWRCMGSFTSYYRYFFAKLLSQFQSSHLKIVSLKTHNSPPFIGLDYTRFYHYIIDKKRVLLLLNLGWCGYE